ncbi:MAG: DUF1846 domain-containing protein [Bacilli bacterium]|nr:DUF1846 domain-containing protein [Bacilli bacterium]
MGRLRPAFDNDKYLEIQKKAILDRISMYDKKLYLEFGGKLFDDYHASRVLPGFLPNAKIHLLLSLKEKAEIVIAVNCKDIVSNKVRGDIGISYSAEVERLITAFLRLGLKVNSVVVSFYEQSPAIDEFEKKLKNNGVKMYRHYQINGYPQNVPLILSKDGLGRNDYIKTTRPLVVVTAPGPGSGKMATCLSQLYLDSVRGIKSGYAKYETFPIWNIPLKHPVNLAYEAATVDLDDVNMIDPYHLEAYGKQAVNYNRDVETFPLLKSIFNQIYGSSPYQSPTDMGVNMAGYAIIDDDAACNASKREIVRRYYEVQKNIFLGRFKDTTLNKIELLMNQVNVTPANRKCVKAALDKHEQCHEPSMAMELPDGRIVTGRRSTLLGASAALLLNALKTLGNIDDSMYLISPSVVEPICKLKTEGLHNNNPRMHAEEALIALAIQANTNPLADIALKQLPNLRTAQVHSSNILSDVDLNTFKKLGVDVTEEPISYIKNILLEHNL